MHKRFSKLELLSLAIQDGIYILNMTGDLAWARTTHANKHFWTVTSLSVELQNQKAL